MSYVEWVRRAVGPRKIFLVFSSVVLRDQNGHVLLQRRTDFDFWGLPGGVLELDEDITQCARRELLEETGLTAGRLHPSGIYTHPQYDVVYPNQDQVQQCTICFRGEVNGGEMRPDGLETSEQAFFKPGDLASVPMPAWYRDMIRDALAGDAIAFTPPFSIDDPAEQVEPVRPLVDKSRLIVVGTSVLVANSDGDVLGLRRPGEACWRLPAGLSRLGENIAQTAVRLVREQTGLRIIPQRIMGIYSASQFHQTDDSGLKTKPVGPLFLARPADKLGRFKPKGQVELMWMPPERLAAAACEPTATLLDQALLHWPDGSFVL